MEEEINGKYLELLSIFNTKLERIVSELQVQIPEKNFSLSFYEPNAYWTIYWLSTKTWKTDFYLKEWFTFRIYEYENTLSLEGNHNVKDLFEQLSDQYFLFNEKSIEDLSIIINNIDNHIKEAILRAVHQEFDPTF